MVRLTLLRILESYFRHRWLYLLPIVLMWGVAAVAVTRDPLYLASGIMYVKQESFLSSLISVRDTTFSWDTAADQASREISELLQTDAFVRAVIKQTDLEASMDEGDEAVEQTMDDVRESVWSNAPGDMQVKVAATHKDPEIAYQLVNAVIENYTHWKINSDLVESITAQTFIDDLVDQYKTDLEIARRELENYLVAHPEPVGGSRPDLEALEIERLRFELELANSRYVDTLGVREDADLALTQAESDVRQTYFFIDAPKVPKEPATSLMDVAVQIVIFTVVGVILSVVGIVGGMLLDRSFRFPIDVQYGLHLPVIATIPDAG